MARSPRNPNAPDVPSPSVERSDDAGSRRDAFWTITQQLHELTSDFSKVSAKTDRLIEDVGELSKDVKKLHGSLQLAKGFGFCAIILIPVCAGFVWWLVGGKLNEIRDRLYQPQASAIAAPPSATPK